PILPPSFLSFYSSCAPRILPPFPTRRSSDLVRRRRGRGGPRDRSLLVAARLSAAVLSAPSREARRRSRLVSSRVRPLDAAVPVDRRRHDAAAGGRRGAGTLAPARLLRPARHLPRDALPLPAPHGPGH